LLHCTGAASAPIIAISSFNALKHTLELPNEQWRVLDHAHRKRNLAEYEGDVDLDLALIRVAREVEQRVLELGRPKP
jgi:hypothetical protein